jgi:rhamnosyltransferase
MPDISVIMRAKDEEQGFLIQALEKLFAQSERNTEIILVYSDFRRETLDFLEKFHNIQLVKMTSAEYSSPGALNRGVRKSGGRILVSLNGDAVPVHDQWLSNLIAPFNDPNVAGVYGRQVPRVDATPWVSLRYEQTFGAHSDVRQRIPHFFSNVNSACRRELWEQHPFAEDVGIAEDIEWAKWACSQGYQIVYVPSAAVYHSHNYDFQQLYKRSVEEGFSLYKINLQSSGIIRLFLSYLAFSIQDVSHLLAKGKVRGSLDALWAHLAIRYGLHAGNKKAKRELMGK